jgi:hemolysin activation/secretion protein
LFAVRSDVDSGKVADFFQVSGRGEFWGARYTQAFPKRDNYGHKLTVGLESKLFVNSVDFLGAPVGTDVGSMPLLLRYSGSALESWGSWGFHAEYAANLGGGPRNSQADYAASRAGASPNWQALRFGADLSYLMDSKWTIAARLRGQQSGEPLIAGEQFGLGGATSVRGFLERETSGDSGHQLNAELWAPPIGETLHAFGFADYGYRKFDIDVPGQNSAESLASIGAGLRWRWQQLDVGADLARVINGIAGGTSSGKYRMHFNLLYRL